MAEYGELSVNTFDYFTFGKEAFRVTKMNEAQKKAKENAEIMLAFAEGARIEGHWRGDPIVKWRDCDPTWNFDQCRYRIAETAAQVTFRTWAQGQGRIRNRADRTNEWLTFHRWDSTIASSDGAFLCKEVSFGCRASGHGFPGHAYEGEKEYREKRIAELCKAISEGKRVVLPTDGIRASVLEPQLSCWDTEQLERMEVEDPPNVNFGPPMPTARTFTKTPEIRWVRRNGANRLQQASVCIETGEIEWEDVPMAQEGE